MNLERGAKRITLVVSMAVGLVAGVYSSISLFDYWYWEREQYLSYERKYENIKWFWKTWDADAWTRDGNKVTKNDVLHTLLDSPWRGIPFTHDDISDRPNVESGSATEFTLYGRDVVPGMNPAMLNLPAAALGEAVQKARKDGLWAAYRNCSTGAYSRPQFLTFSIIGGFSIGLGAFIAVWLSFFLLRWIGRGFSTTTGAVSAKGASCNPTYSLSGESPEDQESDSGGRGSPESAPRTEAQPMTIR
jgi:hypothetical protein